MFLVALSQLCQGVFKVFNTGTKTLYLVCDSMCVYCGRLHEEDEWARLFGRGEVGSCWSFDDLFVKSML